MINCVDIGSRMLINRLPAIMAEQGMSIRQLSRETGITYTTVRAVYHGERRSIQLEVLEEICRVLAVQPGDIYQLDASRKTEGDKGMAPAGSTTKTRPNVRKVTDSQPATRDWRQW
jgi:putative transcriptional regulator